MSQDITTKTKLEKALEAALEQKWGKKLPVIIALGSESPARFAEGFCAGAAWQREQDIETQPFGKPMLPGKIVSPCKKCGGRGHV